MMKVVILCGGLGTRLREETEFRPKPMVPVGDMPILWHIMKTYAHYGFKDFILCLGYKGEVIRDYFWNHRARSSDMTLHLGDRDSTIYHSASQEKDWRVTLLDTGAETQTGGRLAKALTYIDDENFLLTYGDGLTNSNILDTVKFHEERKQTVTLTAVQPASRFGDLDISDVTDSVIHFREKTAQPTWINGGFFVMNRDIARYLPGEEGVLEHEPFARLAAANQIGAFKHTGFWQCMDTYREQQLLTRMWETGKAPWKVW